MDSIHIRLKRFAKNPVRKSIAIIARNKFISRVSSYFIDRFGKPIHGVFFVANVASWKQDIIAELLMDMGAQDVVFVSQYVPFHLTVKQFRRHRNGTLVIWGIEAPEGVQELAEKRGFNIWRMEDGFIRSKGLGSMHTPPASLLIDKTGGLYFRSDMPSALETFLETHDFSDQERDRAAKIISRVLEENITKYNLNEPNEPFSTIAEEKSILILGQCEDDNSILFGSPDIKLNTTLIERVIAAYPSADIYFRPHPDVTAGTRAVLSDVYTFKDQITILDGPFALWDNISSFDLVCVMTSLGGFEALLRGVAVETYGLPFYAGWGLTKDHVKTPRRTRRLTIEDLFFGAYIHAPIYLEAGTGKETTIEKVLESLSK